MSAYADTSFLASLFLPEAGTAKALVAVSSLKDPLFLSVINRMELRNALNLGIVRGRITQAERDDAWQAFEAQVTAGAFVLPDLDMPYSSRLTN